MPCSEFVVEITPRDSKLPTIGHLHTSTTMVPEKYLLATAGYVFMTCRASRIQMRTSKLWSKFYTSVCSPVWSVVNSLSSWMSGWFTNLSSPNSLTIMLWHARCHCGWQTWKKKQRILQGIYGNWLARGEWNRNGTRIDSFILCITSN